MLLTHPIQSHEQQPAGDARQPIQHISCVTHEGKVVLVGIDNSGMLWYTIKQDGYEDNYEGTDNGKLQGWENWKSLLLPDEPDDPSVIERETETLTYVDEEGKRKPILRSLYNRKADDEGTKTAVEPVQLISALEHIYVFRQSQANTLLVDRFVLDGLNNKLIRKYEVRYKRSRKRYEPLNPDSPNSSTTNGLSSFDSLSFRGTREGKDYFYEPTTEISIINTIENGSFSVVLTPTNELDKYRWNIFTYCKGSKNNQQIELISMRASEVGLFDVQDYVAFSHHPGESEVRKPVSVPGIIRRRFELLDKSNKPLVVAPGLSAAKYDVHTKTINTQERTEQLVKDTSKVMLVVPLQQASGTNAVALSFAIARDGTLAKISRNPMGPVTPLRSQTHTVLLPLNTLDNIKSLTDETPAPTGKIARLERSSQDNRLQFTPTDTATLTQLKPGNTIQIKTTVQCNGYHEPVAVSPQDKCIIRKPDTDGLGTWEIIEKEAGGLTYDGLITALAYDAEKRHLAVASPPNSLNSNDKIQISGIQDYDGLYTITEVEPKSGRVTLDVLWRPGEVANLRVAAEKRRGIHFDGQKDYIAVPALDLKPSVDTYAFGETYSVWLNIADTGPDEQLIMGHQGERMQLWLRRGKDTSHIELRVHISTKLETEMRTEIKQISVSLPSSKLSGWLHCAGMFHYSNQTKSTTLSLCINGKEEALESKSFAGMPTLATLQSSDEPSSFNRFWIGGQPATSEDKNSCFAGKLSDARVWNRARSLEDIRNTMHLRLTGKEVGLVGSWRLGAIVRENTSQVVDFSVYGNNGTVYGDAYISGVICSRTIAVGNNTLQPVTQYANDDTFAVTQQARYVERFEFRLLDKNSAPLDIENIETADIFKFDYWGKANHRSDKRKPITLSNTTFANLPGQPGWYEAAAEFTVPEGIKLVRTFGIQVVKKDQEDNWQSIEIRRHRIQQVSDAITQEHYSDILASLAPLANESVETDSLIQDMAKKEAIEWQLLEQLEEKRSKADHLNKVIKEPEATITNLEKEVKRLEQEVYYLQHKEHKLATTYNNELKNPTNYYFYLVNKRSGKCVEVDHDRTDDGANVQQYFIRDSGNRKWETIPTGTRGYFYIRNQHSGKVLDVRNSSRSAGGSICQWHQQNNRWNQHWKIVSKGGYWQIINRETQFALSVYKGHTHDGADIIQWTNNGDNYQLWERKTTDTRRNRSIDDAWDQWNNKKQELEAKQRELQNKKDELTGSKQNKNELLKRLRECEAAIKQLEADLKKVQVALGELNQALNELMTARKPIPMKLMSTDEHGLSISGNILPFVRPNSALSATETCEGTVQLTYLHQSRLRQTNFNTVEEGWQPDELPQCVRFSGNNAINLGDRIDITNASFTIEFWAKQDPATAKQNRATAQYQAIVSQHRNLSPFSKGISIGFEAAGQFIFSMGEEQCIAPIKNDLEWHYWSCVYNATSRTQTIYRDGTRLETKGEVSPTEVSGDFWLGGEVPIPGEPGSEQTDSLQHSLVGKLSELRIWRTALSEEEIAINSKLRLSGNEPQLLAYYRLNQLDGIQNLTEENRPDDDLDRNTSDHAYDWWGCTAPIGQLLPMDSESLPRAIIGCEYSTIGQDPDPNRPNHKVAMMRRFLAFSTPKGIQLLPGQRLEFLERQWVGNAQFEPTLLGYIEGAPPVPSENLTLKDDYRGVTSVALMSSEDVSYSWNRSQDAGLGATASLFVGFDQKITQEVGLGVSVGTQSLSTKSGFQGNLTNQYSFLNSSNISSSSGLNITNQLSLTGTPEFQPHFPELGRRFIPKNVGYALVVSGLADVYILRLTRSKRMIRYQVQPNPDVPPDVNTITFLINPAYTMNGSLDGLTGSRATSDRFFQHLPEMRSQYGSLYPASYFRLLEAYALKQQIDYRDQRRQAYFEQFNARLVDEASLGRESNNADYYTGETAAGKEDSTQTLDQEIEALERRIGELLDKQLIGKISNDEREDLSLKQAELSRKKEEKEKNLENKLKELQQDQKAGDSASANKKEEEIKGRFKDASQQIHATESFANWQRKMENIQVLAGKRNIVNTYVWDADGGIYSESQQFANTIQHTIGGSFSLDVAAGGQGAWKAWGVGWDLQAQATVHMTQTMTKTESRSKGFELNVEIDRVENRGITDYRDRPIIPGEKVNRYRFMSFYLEGSSDNFNDFFDYVVDPEWLASNSEEARALRQVDTSSPNKTWRILHRVTYVERPTLKGG